MTDPNYAHLSKEDREAVEAVNKMLKAAHKLGHDRSFQYRSLLRAGILLSIGCDMDRSELKRWLNMMVDACGTNLQ